MGYGDGIREAFGCLGVMIIILLILVFLLEAKTCSRKIESDKLLTPEIKLIINNNQIDTLYIYKK